ncbi:hypothetical protein [Nocardioides sp.]|uniref:hypothetical protein n=1 Tax=Nocardioides sp. TaxID=35761 RepID=UPI002C5DCA65|nr:hypothetical protein [Nocardioides sp.]HXH80022.1 hypothetical protein [Nocardioides sp.]
MSADPGFDRVLIPLGQTVGVDGDGLRLAKIEPPSVTISVHALDEPDRPTPGFDPSGIGIVSSQKRITEYTEDVHLRLNDCFDVEGRYYEVVSIDFTPGTESVTIRRFDESEL